MEEKLILEYFEGPNNLNRSNEVENEDDINDV